MRAILAFMFMLSASGVPAAGQSAAGSGEVCIRNGSGETYVFAAEAAGGDRALAVLAPGEMLCSAGADGTAQGVVSVYEEMDSLEGCSRLVRPGMVETLAQYAPFDRCGWGASG